MRLVDFEEFCRMPAGTVFAPYKPCVLEGCLSIKTDAGEDMPYGDSHSKHVFNGVMPLEPSFGDEFVLWEVGDTQEASFEIYDGSYADYMDHQMFLVFDGADIDRMINALVWAKNGCEGFANCSVDEDV